MAPISDKIPVLKKKIGSFLSKEEGKITKENLIKAGVLVAAFSVAAAMNAKPVSSHSNCEPAKCQGLSKPSDPPNHNNNPPAKHDNSVAMTLAGGTATGTHGHCVHDCHANHASY